MHDYLSPLPLGFSMLGLTRLVLLSVELHPDHEGVLDNLQFLTGLQELELTAMIYMRQVPDCLYTGLTGLRKLSITQSDCFQTVSPLISNMSRLEELVVESDVFIHLPDEVHALPSLRVLEIESPVLLSVSSAIGRATQLESLGLTLRG